MTPSTLDTAGEEKHTLYRFILHKYVRKGEEEDASKFGRQASED